MMVALLLIASATALASRPPGQEAQEKAVSPEDSLPDGEGRNLIRQACVQCHDLRNTVSQRKTAAAWRRTINEMIWRGAPLMSDEAEIIAKYLAASFGPDRLKPNGPSNNVTLKPQDRKRIAADRYRARRVARVE